jgi:hypothetical protein
MAANFQLLCRTTGKATSFNLIDEQLCAAFAQPVDDDKYLCDWYNSIGWRVATGNSLDQVRTIFIGYIVEAISKGDQRQVTGYTDLIALLNWLTQNYTTDSWTTVGK